MEKRNGTWTSQTRANDAGDIWSLARKILERDLDPETRKDVERIKRLARDLEDD